MEGQVPLTIQQVGIKAKSKKEVYTVLTVEGGLYLPPLSDVNHKFLKSILLGDKKYLLCKNVLVVKVPYIDNLRVKNILLFAADKVDISSYLPEYEYNKDPQREWICNVVNTLLHDKFKEFIASSMRAREKKLVQNKRLNVVALPQFIKMFANSNNVSVSKGRTHFLLRSPFSKRKCYEMETDNQLLEEEKEKIEQLELKISQQQDKILKQKSLEDSLLKDKGKLVKLYQEGYIDSDGEPKHEIE